MRLFIENPESCGSTCGVLLLRSRCGSIQWLFRCLSVDNDWPVRTVLVEDDSGDAIRVVHP